MNEKEIKEKIKYHENRLNVWKAQLNAHIAQEYVIRRKKNLEVESDRKDLERANKALKRLRETAKDD